MRCLLCCYGRVFGSNFVEGSNNRRKIKRRFLIGQKRKKENVMNEKLVNALEKLIDYERNSTTFYQDKQIQMNWKLNTIRRMVNYQTN